MVTGYRMKGCGMAWPKGIQKGFAPIKKLLRLITPGNGANCNPMHFCTILGFHVERLTTKTGG